eukprot:1373377-Pyramimonas_sp.AAC.1
MASSKFQLDWQNIRCLFHLRPPATSDRCRSGCNSTTSWADAAGRARTAPQESPPVISVPGLGAQTAGKNA